MIGNSRKGLLVNRLVKNRTSKFSTSPDRGLRRAITSSPVEHRETQHQTGFCWVTITQLTSKEKAQMHRSDEDEIAGSLVDPE
jgi:hypothetical protein